MCVCPIETPLEFARTKHNPVPLDRHIPHTDSGIGEEQLTSVLNGSDVDHTAGLLISTLSSEVKKSLDGLPESPGVEVLKPPPPPPSSSINSISQPNKGINVKEILKSLVAGPVECLEAGLEAMSYPDPAANTQAQNRLPMQFHSFDR